MKKKLIEVALPLEAINRESAREKSIRHGHPSTLHLWWARRPLAACRAVLFATLVDDPSSDPVRFPDDVAQQAERERLFRLIETLVDWDRASDPAVLAAAREEIRSAVGSPPTVVDPFAGGASIPLEAQRLGLPVEGYDLNPIAALLGKALVEVPASIDLSSAPPRAGSGQLSVGATATQRLAADIRHYGRLLRERAHQLVGHLYPAVAQPDGGKMAPLTYIWARTVTCPNPACSCRTPLVRSFVLRTRGQRIWAEPVIDESRDVTFRLRQGSGEPASTVSRRGVRCVRCGETFSLDHVKASGSRGDMEPRLIAIVATDRNGRRDFVEPSREQERVARSERPSWQPDEEMSTHPQYMGTPRYGLTHFADLFTPRQLVALTTFVDSLPWVREQVIIDGAEPAYADALKTYLALAVSRGVDYWSSCASWVSSGEFVRGTFARQAISMTWDFAEAVPFASASGGFDGAVEWIARVVERLPGHGDAHIYQRDSATLSIDKPIVVSTDPPYYDNVPYADLSDYFYVWLRRMLGDIYPDLFATILSPKQQELVADQVRWGGKTAAKEHFEEGMARVFRWMHDAQDPAYPLTIFYAFKQSEAADANGGVASTGWETMLSALIGAGFAVVGTWPVRTERSGRTREIGANALASSVVLVCRHREVDARLATRKDFTSALKRELPEGLRLLQQGNIAPVDLAQAAIGPGMAIFSRFERVLEADGSAMSVRQALSVINDALDELLAEQESDFDAETRWAVPWFEQYGQNPGPFGTADTLARAKNTAVAALVTAGIVESRGGKVRLLERTELDEQWDPLTDRRLTVWETVQHLIRTLEQDGEVPAAELVRRLGGIAEASRELAYRLYVLCERKGWTSEALAYNGLVVAWPELTRLAGSPRAGGQGAFEV